jgi:hypothetical protein
MRPRYRFVHRALGEYMAARVIVRSATMPDRVSVSQEWEVALRLADSRGNLTGGSPAAAAQSDAEHQ